MATNRALRRVERQRVSKNRLDRDGGRIGDGHHLDPDRARKRTGRGRNDQLKWRFSHPQTAARFRYTLDSTDGREEHTKSR